jgi:S1-C subfamily serine protease
MFTRGLGGLSTYVGAPVITYMDYQSMQAGEIGPGRFTFRLGGTASSIAGGTLIGAEIGGPYGALAGAAISGVSWGAEKSYDGLKWFGNQLSNGMIQTENALKNGWSPGR